MTHILIKESEILECEDFSYNESNGFYKFCDNSEGECIGLFYDQFINAIEESLKEDGIGRDILRELAVNIFANSTRSGRAHFLFNILP